MIIPPPLLLRGAWMVTNSCCSVGSPLPIVLGRRFIHTGPLVTFSIAMATFANLPDREIVPTEIDIRGLSSADAARRHLSVSGLRWSPATDAGGPAAAYGEDTLEGQPAAASRAAGKRWLHIGSPT
jgi:hypothetical protein